LYEKARPMEIEDFEHVEGLGSSPRVIFVFCHCAG
jgi:hypothetical protein